MYNKLQEVMVEAMGLKVGDKVIVTRKYEKGEMGFKHPRSENEDKLIGTKCIVRDIYENGVIIEGNFSNYTVPIFVLQKVENREIELTNLKGEILPGGGFKVYGNIIPFAKIEEIYLAAKKQKGE